MVYMYIVKFIIDTLMFESRGGICGNKRTVSGWLATKWIFFTVHGVSDFYAE